MALHTAAMAAKVMEGDDRLYSCSHDGLAMTGHGSFTASGQLRG